LDKVIRDVNLKNKKIGWKTGKRTVRRSLNKQLEKRRQKLIYRYTTWNYKIGRGGVRREVQKGAAFNHDRGKADCPQNRAHRMGRKRLSIAKETNDLNPFSKRQKAGTKKVGMRTNVSSKGRQVV